MTEGMSSDNSPSALLTSCSSQKLIKSPFPAECRCWKHISTQSMFVFLSLILSLWNIPYSRGNRVWRTAGHGKPAERKIKCIFFTNQYSTVWRWYMFLGGLEIECLSNMTLYSGPWGLSHGLYLICLWVICKLIYQN